MQYLLLLICLSALLSCGKPKQTSMNTQVSPSSVNVDTTHQSDENKEGYSIDFNHQNEYLSYGSILGKPVDTIMGADTVWFYYQGKLVFKEITENHYAFYKHIKHWPKLIDLTDGSYLYLLEHMVGEPEGSEIIGFQFKNEKLIKKVSLKEYPWWKIDMSKDYTKAELKDIIGNNPL